MSNEQHKHDLKHRITSMEKQIFNLSGNERIKARIEYQKLLKSYTKECGFEEPIYIKRT